MKIKPLFVALLITVLTLTAVQTVFASEHRLYTLSGFVEALIEKGLIGEQYASKAREIVARIERTKHAEELVEKQVRNSDKLEVRVSQYIDQSSLTFNRFEDVTGLLLIAKNISTSTEFFDAKRGCQIVYRIYSETGELVYDRSTEDVCQTTESVTYAIQGEKSRIFEVTHTQAAHQLQSGVYRFEVEYPGYGKGEKMVTITQ